MIDPLGLRPHEIQVMNAAAWAKTVTPNGHFLVPCGRKKAAERLIARGFLTEVDRIFSDKSGIIVFVSPENVATMKAALPSGERTE